MTIVIETTALAAITPIPPLGKAMGTVLAVLVAAAGAWMALRYRRSQLGKLHPAVAAIVHVGRRQTMAALMCVCGAVMLVGVWIDPRELPQTFVAVWASALVIIGALACLASIDFLSIGRSAHRARARLEIDRQESTQRALRDHFQHRPHQQNGAPSDN